MNKRYQLFDDLTDKEYQALKDDIEKRGIVVPIEVDEHGNVLDGHHRIKAWGELKAEGRPNGGDYSRIVRAGMTEAEKRNHVRALNLLRRHLTKEQRAKIWAEMRADGMTYEAIAQATGVSEKTVRNSESEKSDSQPAVVVSKSGKKRPSKYKPRKPKPHVFVKSQKEQQRAIEAFEKTDGLPDKALDLKRLEYIAREQAAQERAKKVTGDISTGSANLLLGDMRERGAEIGNDSVDLIFTDPPYPEEFLPLWSDLSALAARVLRPGGMLIAYTGAMFLPEVITRLSEHLTFYWAGAIVLDGPHSRVYAKNIAQCSKPLLFFVRKDFSKSDMWFEDTFKSEGEQKEGHDWQQSLGAALYYIEKLTNANAVVLDPFLGAGTTGEAAVKLGRTFIGIEIDKVAFANASERIRADG